MECHCRKKIFEKCILWKGPNLNVPKHKLFYTHIYLLPVHGMLKMSHNSLVCSEQVLSDHLNCLSRRLSNAHCVQCSMSIKQMCTYTHPRLAIPPSLVFSVVTEVRVQRLQQYRTQSSKARAMTLIGILTRLDEKKSESKEHVLSYDGSKKDLLSMLWIRNNFFGSRSYFSVGFGSYLNLFYYS